MYKEPNHAWPGARHTIMAKKQMSHNGKSMGSDQTNPGSNLFSPHTDSGYLGKFLHASVLLPVKIVPNCGRGS